jgi:hypothetical protein
LAVRLGFFGFLGLATFRPKLKLVSNRGMATVFLSVSLSFAARQFAEGAGAAVRRKARTGFSWLFTSINTHPESYAPWRTQSHCPGLIVA